MNIQLSDFQLANGGDDDLLPLYIQKNQEPKNLNRKTVFLFSLCLFVFCITSICIKNFVINTSLIKSQLRDDDLYYRFE